MKYSEEINRALASGSRLQFVKPKRLEVEKSSSSYGKYAVRYSNAGTYYAWRLKEAKAFIAEALAWEVSNRNEPCLVCGEYTCLPREDVCEECYKK